MLGFREECLAAPECLLRLLSFTDIPEKAGKYFVTVSGYFAEGDLYGKLLAILTKRSQFGALPVYVPLTGSKQRLNPLWWSSRMRAGIRRVKGFPASSAGS